ncbi:MAG TPA: hypothetical protein VGL28_02690 [Steroidobacteraceae bacterium]|jgi:hypothetical protein
MIRRTSGSALAAALLIFGLSAQAQTPATSPYNTDPQNFYVQDDTSQGIGNLNMVLCVVAGLDPGDMVNAGPYVALVDMTKCNSDKGGGSNNNAAGATDYATGVVIVTRASNTEPMIGKVWLSLTEDGGSTNVYAYLSATQSPSSSSPYGVFRLDYVGQKNGQIGFNGFIDAQPTSISQYETGSDSSNSAMTLNASSTAAGSGTIATLGGSSFNFAYNSGYFRRSDGTNDLCFDRSRANAQVSVWQYGTYNANDGSRVDLAHPGFPILATYAGTAYYGFANYWGINFQGLDLNSIADAQPISGLSIVDQRPDNTTSYTLAKVGGKLTKWTQQSTTLDALNGIPVTAGIDLTGLTSGNAAVTGFQNWQLQWSSADQSFTVTGTQQCDSNGCVVNTITPVATVDGHAFDSLPLSGWANSYGGSINIPQTGAPHQAGDAVNYFLQSTVIPGSAGLMLYCLSQCPTAAALAAFVTGTNQSTPFGNNTDQQWFSAQSANTVTYQFDAGGLEDVSGSSPVAMVVEQSSQFPSGSMYAQNGINSGRLFDTALTIADCPGGTAAGTVCEPANPRAYYTWQTGSQQWTQSLWLIAGGHVVPFDAPQNIPYTVPTGATYGSYAGLPILLQFDGFGNLNGIPGYCVDPVDNATVDCNTPNSRYVPMFSIADGTMLTLPNPSTPLLVKALNAEIRLKNLGPSGSSPCASMTLTPVTPPAGGTHDPSSSADSEYLGTKPTVTAAPKVIDGVLQQ